MGRLYSPKRFTTYALRLTILLPIVFSLKLASQPLCYIPRYLYSLPHSKDWRYIHHRTFLHMDYLFIPIDWKCSPFGDDHHLGSSLLYSL
nr:MAG TPA: hypothetical protein [Caudoviricetes sp.]